MFQLSISCVLRKGPLDHAFPDGWVVRIPKEIQSATDVRLAEADDGLDVQEAGEHLKAAEALMVSCGLEGKK